MAVVQLLLKKDADVSICDKVSMQATASCYNCTKATCWAVGSGMASAVMAVSHFSSRLIDQRECM